MFLNQYSFSEIVILIIISIVFSYLVNRAKPKVLKKINLLFSVAFLIWCFFAINNKAVSMNEAIPYLLVLAVYFTYYFAKSSFDIKILNKED